MHFLIRIYLGTYQFIRLCVQKKEIEDFKCQTKRQNLLFGITLCDQDFCPFSDVGSGFAYV
jgi:hypothetical protein